VLLSFSAFSHLVLAIYASCGSLLICCLETQLKFVRVMIALNFGFLFNSVWRFIFYLMLGSIGWSYNNIFGKAMGIAFISVACFNTYVLLRYPSYRKIREKIAEEEDRRIEAKISKDVKKRMANQIVKS
jgi:COPI associated protein